jgi:hypothetical protein
MKMHQCLATYKFLLVIAPAVMAFAVNVSAQNVNVSAQNIDLEAEEESRLEATIEEAPLAAPLLDLTDSASTIDYARVRRCCVSSGSISVQTRDLFLPGDIWRAVVHEGGASDVTSNTSGKGSGAPALGPGVFGNVATIARQCAWVVTTFGNTVPAGLPAGGQTRVTSSTGGSAICSTESTHP